MDLRFSNPRKAVIGDGNDGHPYVIFLKEDAIDVHPIEIGFGMKVTKGLKTAKELELIELLKETNA